MKKTLLTMATIGAMALSANATIILNEPFSYSDGGLTNVSSGAWTNHSGANSGSVQVINGQIQLVTTAAEDVMRSLGGSYTTQPLYVSFKLNLTVLPSGSPTYFAHFAKDPSTFKSRIWAVTNNAAAGKYRLAVTSSVSTAGLWTNIPVDLDVSTDYKVVMRFLDGTNATLWINPTSEASIVARADGSDANTLGTWAAQFFAFRQSSGMGTMFIDDLLIGSQFSDVQTIGGPPSISGLVPVNISANTSTGPLPFVISDVETPAASLTVSATSSNPTLIPNNPANLTFGGAGGNRTLNVTPASGQQGVASIEVVVTDASSFTATNTFTVTVGSPTISGIANQSAPTNTLVGPIAFTVGDGETSPGSLTVTATSSDQGILPDGNIIISNLGGSNRTISLTSVAPGFVTVTVTVNDGSFSIPTTFTVSAYPLLGYILEDDFTYPDGSFVTNAAPFWNAYSGATGQTQVVNGKLFLASAQSEDMYALLTNAPYATTGGYVLYSRFIVNFTSLPTGSGGDYFAFFKDGTTGGFRARIFAMTNGAAAGKYRIGVANGGFTTTGFPLDLSLGTPVVVIARYDVGAASTKLWINPTSESSTSITAADGTSPLTIYTYTFRQGGASGNLSVDGLKVATSFNQVFTSVAPVAEALQYQVYGSDLVLSWTSPSFALQAAPFVTGTYTNISGATSPYTNSMTGSQKYFRLSYP